MRERIIQEFEAMLNVQGVKTVTMDMLASRLGISKKTLYEHFDDKDQLLEETIKSMILRKHAAYQQMAHSCDNVLEAMIYWMSKGMKWIKDYQPNVVNEIKKYHPEIYERVILAHFLDDKNNLKEMILRGIEQGVFRPDVNADILSIQLHATFFLISRTDLFPPDRFFCTEVIREILYNYLRGLCSDTGLHLLPGYIKEHLE